MIVRKRLVAPLRKLRKPAAVGEKHQKHRRIRDPRHIRDQRRDGALLGLVADDQNIGLLQIAFRRRGERAGTEQPDEIGLDRARQETPVHAMPGNARKLVEPRQTWIDGEGFAEPFGKRVFDQPGGRFRFGLLLHRGRPPRCYFQPTRSITADMPPCAEPSCISTSYSSIRMRSKPANSRSSSARVYMFSTSLGPPVP